MADTPFGLRHPADPCRRQAGSGHRRAADADLPEHRLRVPRRGACRAALQPAGARLHLLAADQPDGDDAGRAADRARGRRGRGLHLVGPRGADHGALPADAARATTSSRRPGSMAARSPSSPTPSAASAGRRSSPTPRISRRWRRWPTTDTRAIFCESIANPGGYVTDIPALAEVAKRIGVPLIVDNTSATPYLCRPFEMGADLVVHSTTKYLTGNATVVGGVLIDSRQLRLVGLRQVPEPDRARARLPRAEVPRDLRGDGLHLPLDRHRDARPRHDHGAAERVPDAARHRDAVAADEEARGERGGGRHLAGEGPAGRVRDLRRGCRRRPGTTGRSGSIRTGPGRSSPSR